LIPGRPIVALLREPAGRASFAMLDLIYIVVGIAVLGVFGLYAAALRRI
jgi:hypothetical protein